MTEVDIPRVQETLVLFSRVSPEAQMLQMKNMCNNNDGIWAIPENPKDYQPVLYEMSLFGVPAIANDPNDLPNNWRRAAQNILEALAETPQVFECPEWPQCACPGGTVRPDCPGLAKLREKRN